MEISWGANPGSLGDVRAPEAHTGGAVTADSVANHGRTSAAALSVPAAPGLAVPSDLPSSLPAAGVAVSGYRFAYEDSYGLSRLSLDPDWYPLSAYRTDSRLEKALLVELAYDSSNRITQKKTFYGSTEALVVNIGYDSDSFPVKVTTSGEAMLLPLEYAIEYGSGHQIKKISVTSSDNLLMYFVYANTSAATADTVRSIDPFRFIDSMLASSTIISHYDGDNKLVETFTGRANASDPVVSFDVADSEGKPTGSYTVTCNADRLPIALSAKKADGTVLWTREFGPSSSFFDSVKVDNSDIASLEGFSYEYGRLLETWVSGGASDPVAGLAENFVYDLLF